MLPIVDTIVGIVGKLLDKVIPDATARDKAKAELIVQLQSQEFQLALGQITTNTEEAKSTNWFVAGWRPAVGWCGVAGLTYQYLLMPLGNAVALGLGHPAIFIALDVGTLMTLLFGMLGLGAYRTYEKTNGMDDARSKPKA